jgi:HD-GYP domain-containing protein (c-di-GMP phosphodiesterase class II)
VGHSPHVAGLAAGAAGLMGMDDQTVEQVRAAGLLHDLGRTAVSSEIWNRPGPLGPADQERVRLHSYLTERILVRCPAVAPLAAAAAAHHERLDGGGYHPGASSTELDPAVRAGAGDFHRKPDPGTLSGVIKLSEPGWVNAR